MISSNFLHLLLHHIVDDADFRDFQRRADLHGVDVPIVDRLVGQLVADTQHLPKLFNGHDVWVFREHHLVKLSELTLLHRFEPPLLVLKPHFCDGFCLHAAAHPHRSCPGISPRRIASLARSFLFREVVASLAGSISFGGGDSIFKVHKETVPSIGIQRERHFIDPLTKFFKILAK